MTYQYVFVLRTLLFPSRRVRTRGLISEFKMNKLTLQEIESPGGVPKILLERGDNPEKGGLM